MTEAERIEGFLIDLRAATIRHGVTIDDCPCGCGQKMIRFVREDRQGFLSSCRYVPRHVPGVGASFNFRMLDS